MNTLDKILGCLEDAGLFATIPRSFGMERCTQEDRSFLTGSV